MNAQECTTEEVFLAAIEFQETCERSVFLDQACRGDARQRGKIESLVETYESLANVPALADRSLSEIAPHLSLTASRYRKSLGRLGRYELLRVLAAGRMSVVLAGFDGFLNRIVAIKVLGVALCQDPQHRERFYQEARIAAAIDHVHVTKIFAVEEHEKVPYLVMEFVVGRSLSSLVQDRGRLSLEETLRIGGQIAQGLAAFHRRGLLHRDVKPENILLDSTSHDVKIIDFGTARALDGLRLTVPGEFLGTPEFMSPEQAQGLQMDHRSDLFSLGALLYTLASGISPFASPTALAAMKRVCDDSPEPLGEQTGNLPKWFVRVVGVLLEKDPADREYTAEGLAERFLREAEGRSRAQGRRPGRFTPGRVSAAIAAGLLALVALYWSSVPEDDNTPFFRRLAYRCWGYPQLVVKCDDSTVVCSVYGQNARGEDVSIPRLSQSRQWLLPGRYLVRGSQDGREIGSQWVSLQPWDEKVVQFDGKADAASTEKLALLQTSSEH